MSTRHIPIVVCRNCALYNTARVLGLESPDCSTLDRVVIRNHPVERNQSLFSAGDPVRYLYLVHSGSCISYNRKEPHQVMGFYLPGEVVGIEDIGEAVHSHSAFALENGSLCQLDFTALEAALDPEELSRVLKYLLQAAAIHARQLQEERLVTGLPSAEQRIAGFLLNLARRFESHGLPSRQYRLPMSREEMASYLGLAPETVIRTLRKLHSKGLVAIRTRQIQILEPDALDRLLAA